MNETWTQIVEVLRQVVSGPELATIGGLIAADVLLALAVAVKAGKFDIFKLLKFYQTQVVPFIIGFIAVKVLALLAVPELIGEQYADYVSAGLIGFVWASIVLTEMGSILGHLLGLGVKVPGMEPPEA